MKTESYRWRCNSTHTYIQKNILKGSVSRDFFTLVFFIKHLLLVSLDTPRQDFEIVRIFEELFEFVINSPVYSQWGSRDSLMYSSPGSWDSPVLNNPGSRPKLVNKKTFNCKILQGVETPLWLIHWGVLTPWFITNENIFFESYYDEKRKFRMNHIAYNMLILVITKS